MPRCATIPASIRRPTVRQRLFFDTPVTPQYERLRTRAWTRVKTGE